MAAIEEKVYSSQLSGVRGKMEAKGVCVSWKEMRNNIHRHLKNRNRVQNATHFL